MSNTNHDITRLEEKISSFWVAQATDIEKITDFKGQQKILPIARIKKIMKSDEDVRLISGEVPMLFSKACQLFIEELTIRAWNNTEEGRRKTLQRSDIATAISKNEAYDFLIDIVPREDKFGKQPLPDADYTVHAAPIPLPNPSAPPPNCIHSIDNNLCSIL